MTVVKKDPRYAAPAVDHMLEISLPMRPTIQANKL